jgi:hypothetical protein
VNIPRGELCDCDAIERTLLDNLGREPVTGVADFLHSLGYRDVRGIPSAKRRDNAFPRHFAVIGLG